MHLYDVFYYGNAMDSSIPLPEPDSDIRYAKNTNWDGHYKHVRKIGEKQYEWVDGPPAALKLTK